MFKKSHLNNKSKGFTLIELLVVVAIFSMLFSTAAASLLVAKRKANDAKRISDVKNIQKAMEIYYNDYYAYPDESSSNDGWEYSYEDGGSFLEVLTDEEYVSGKTPVDPLNNQASGKYYAYYKFPAGANGCDASKGGYYVLGIRDMETSGNPHPSSPGWSCDDGAGNSHDWQNDFEWVTGEFEY